MLLNAAFSQVEHYLSWNNFAVDFFLQSNRDEHGWILLDVIQGFPKMKVLGVDNGHLATLLRHSRIVEVDETNTRVRSKPSFRLVSPYQYGNNCAFFVDIYGNPYPMPGFFPSYYFDPHCFCANGYFWAHQVPQNSFAVPTEPCGERAAEDFRHQPDMRLDSHDEKVSAEEEVGLEPVAHFAVQQTLTAELNFDQEPRPFVTVQPEQLPVSTAKLEDEHIIATEQVVDDPVSAELPRNPIKLRVEEPIRIEQDEEEEFRNALNKEETICPGQIASKSSLLAQADGSATASRNYRSILNVTEKNLKAETKRKSQSLGRDRGEAYFPLFTPEDFPVLPCPLSSLSTAGSGRVPKKLVPPPLTTECFPSLPSTCSSVSSKTETCFDDTAEFPPLPGSWYAPNVLNMTKEALRVEQQAALFPPLEVWRTKDNPACQPEPMNWSPRSLVAGAGYWLWRNSD